MPEGCDCDVCQSRRNQEQEHATVEELFVAESESETEESEPEVELCANCDEETGTCQCWTCPGCDRRRAEDDHQCSNCEECERCCCCWYCEGCNETLGESDGRCSNCERCTDNCCDCPYCESCCESVSRDAWCRRCDTCEGCCDGRCDSSDYIHNYSYKPEPEFFCEEQEDRDKARYYGLELEVNCSADKAEAVDSRLGGHAYLKEDGSLDSGFEIVTHPHTFRSMRRLWTEYFKRPVRGLSSYKSGECGLHIHISRKGLTEPQIKRMVVFLNAPENTPLIEQIAQRGSNHYSQISPKKLATAMDCRSRYEALNLENYHTIELRIFRGSYRLDRVLKGLDFADALVEFTRDRSYRELTEAHFRSFLSKNRKRYKWLWSFLTGETIATGKDSSTRTVDNPSQDS